MMQDRYKKTNLNRIIFFLLWCIFISSQLLAQNFLKEYPNLQNFIYEQPKSNFYLGLGLIPVGLVNERLFVGCNIFQLHWITDYIDSEILSVYFAYSKGNKSYAQAQHYGFKTSLKYRLLNYLSLGGLVGYEYISFPKASVRLIKNEYMTPLEPFSSQGLIYGVIFTQLLQQKNYNLKINELVYTQTYSTKKTKEGWEYRFDNKDIQQDVNKRAVSAGWVLAIEFSVLY